MISFIYPINFISLFSAAVGAGQALAKKSNPDK
jgi:hypothetical protein